MVIKLQSFDKGGKAEGPALIMWDDEFCFAECRAEANGGITIMANKEDEFGNESRVLITLDKVDIDQMKNRMA